MAGLGYAVCYLSHSWKIATVADSALFISVTAPLTAPWLLQRATVAVTDGAIAQKTASLPASVQAMALG
jgi:hypothetical protein